MTLLVVAVAAAAATTSAVQTATTTAKVLCCVLIVKPSKSCLALYTSISDKCAGNRERKRERERERETSGWQESGCWSAHIDWQPTSSPLLLYQTTIILHEGAATAAAAAAAFATAQTFAFVGLLPTLASTAALYRKVQSVEQMR